MALYCVSYIDTDVTFIDEIGGSSLDIPVNTYKLLTTSVSTSQS